ncbi:MAG: tyrosine-type recombinase/integrase [Terracidiphilus sp.]|jgi:integrase/recombinase XerD
MNTLRDAVQNYLEMRRGLGFKLQEAAKALPDFVAFLEQHHASYITQALALAWAQLPSHTRASYQASRLTIVRGFARYRSATDSRTQIPPCGLLPFKPKRARPFFYSDGQIRALLDTAFRMKCPHERGRLRSWVYYSLLGLISVTGLRLGEARNLQLQDVDLKTAVLTIRGAKFGKDRLVPLHRSTCAVLAKYIAKRRQHWEGRAVSSYLFVSSLGNRLDTGDVHRTFYKLSREIGLRGPSDGFGPRIHDLRHRFAVMTLLRWYRAGKDVEQRLPFLSAYLGHVHVSDTFWYLSAWPELMQQAMTRVERCWEGQS